MDFSGIRDESKIYCNTIYLLLEEMKYVYIQEAIYILRTENKVRN